MALCSICKYPLEEGAKFCPKCGHEVNGAQQEVTDAASSGQTKKMGCWSKGLIIFAAFLFIGFLADMCSDEERVAEQPQEIEAERQAQKAKAEAERQAQEAKAEAERQVQEEQEKHNRKATILKEGYDRGYEDAIQYTYYGESHCRIPFQNLYGVPKTDEEINLYKQYKAQYDKGWDKGREVKRKMEE